MDTPTVNIGPVTKHLSDPDNWSKGGESLTAEGYAVPYNHPRAKKFSVVKCIQRYYPANYKEQFNKFMEVANKYYPGIQYKVLHRALTHDVLMMLLKESGI